MTLPQRAVWLLDEALDRLPRIEDGKFYRYGHWGCSLGLSKYWNAGTGHHGEAER